MKSKISLEDVGYYLITVLRYDHGDDRTLGLVMRGADHICYSLEDPYNYPKIPGRTCIPTGKYRLALRTEGSLHTKYAKRFPALHRGMLHLQHVPGFSYIYIHIGNTSEDTEGCILVGAGVSSNGNLLDSTTAYLQLYTMVSNWIVQGNVVDVLVSDYAEMMKFEI